MENFVFCLHTCLILTNEVLNEKIWHPLSILAKKSEILFRKFHPWWKWTNLKNSRTGGTSAQFFIKLRTCYLCLNLKQQERLHSGRTYALFFINDRNLSFFFNFYLLQNCEYSKVNNKLDIRHTDTTRVASHGAACAILFLRINNLFLAHMK